MRTAGLAATERSAVPRTPSAVAVMVAEPLAVEHEHPVLADGRDRGVTRAPVELRLPVGARFVGRAGAHRERRPRVEARRQRRHFHRSERRPRDRDRDLDHDRGLGPPVRRAILHRHERDQRVLAGTVRLHHAGGRHAHVAAGAREEDDLPLHGGAAGVGGLRPGAGRSRRPRGSTRTASPPARSAPGRRLEQRAPWWRRSTRATRTRRCNFATGGMGFTDSDNIEHDLLGRTPGERNMISPTADSDPTAARRVGRPAGRCVRRLPDVAEGEALRERVGPGPPNTGRSR